jgi:hypothetical protein
MNLNDVFRPYELLDTHTPTGSTLGRKEGMFVLRLFGSPGERGEAHGRLMKKYIIDSGVNVYYGNFLSNLYESSDLAKKLPGGLRKTVGDILENWYYTPFEKMLLPETREELEGIAEGAGIDAKEIFRGYAAPDLMEHLAAGFLRGGKQSLGNYYLGGCSGVYVRDSAVKTGGKAMFARNMDFPGAFVWKYPVVVCSYPEEKIDVRIIDESGKTATVIKPKQPYAYISVSGFPGTGLTGYSSSGFAMATFVLFSKNIAKRGMLMLDFNHYLFTRHETLSAIERTIAEEDMPCGTPHAVLFADREQAFTVESDSRRNIIRNMGRDMDVLVQTNHFTNPRMKKRQIEFPLEQEHTVARFRTLTDAVGENYGTLSVQRMIDIISSNQYTVSEDVRLLGDFPAQPTTLKSVVFEPGSGKFWVASGMPPAVCYNTYVGFTFTGEREGREMSKKLPSLRRSSRPVFKEMDFQPVTAVMKRSLSIMMLSQEYLKQGNLSAAESAAERAVRLYREPGYLYILGIIYMKTGRTGEALDLLRQVREKYPYGPVKYSALILWEGRCLDLLKKREEAVEVYREGRKMPGLVPHMEDAFHAALKRPFTADKLPASFDYFLLGPLNFI